MAFWRGFFHHWLRLEYSFTDESLQRRVRLKEELFSKEDDALAALLKDFKPQSVAEILKLVAEFDLKEQKNELRPDQFSKITLWAILQTESVRDSLVHSFNLQISESTSIYSLDILRESLTQNQIEGEITQAQLESLMVPLFQRREQLQHEYAIGLFTYD